jgi:hypothetical protein
LAYKPFSEFLHQKYDEPARKAVASWVKMQWGLDAIDNPDKYGVDLICFRSSVPVGALEVEVRESDLTQYDSIHVAQRKAKLFLNDLPVLFFALTHDLHYAYWVKADLIKGCPLIEVKNRYVTTGEFFYDCPRSMFKRVDLTQPF